MSLGLCCHYLEKNNKGVYVNTLKQRTVQLGRWKKGLYSFDDLKKIWISNLDTLIFKLPFVFKKYSVFRLPSGIFPLYDQVPFEMLNDQKILLKLEELGVIVKESNVRATFHPGQFCSLSSDSGNVINNSITEINHHAWIFDMMRLPVSSYYAINVHGGKANRINTLINSIKTLPHSTRLRLTLENDESCYSITDLLHVFKETNTPIVFDSHHHTFNTGYLKLDDAFNVSLKTWGNIKPLQHISNSKNTLNEKCSFQKKRAHSDFIYSIPKCQYDALKKDIIDIDVEAKMKNLAIDDLILQFL